MGYQLLGVDPTQITAATAIPEFPLGSIGEDEKGNRFIYGRANGAIVAKVPCAMDSSYDFVDGNGVVADAVSMVAFSDNQFGWFQVYGVCEDVNVEAGTAAGGLLALIADANGDFQAADNDSVTNGLGHVRAKALTAIAANVSDIYLY
jgi:hypothetical protein